MKRIRADAPMTPSYRRWSVRLDRAGGGSFAQVWFLTRGCSWDRAGACTMCNYGHGPMVTNDEMIESVQLALASIEDPVDEVLVSPSGSMCDPAEVPVDARTGILEHIAAFRASAVCVETRPETVTAETVSELVAALKDKHVAVEMGLESSSEWVRRFSINKAGGLGSFTRAAGILRARGVRAYANVALGSAFLTAAEAIDDARLSTLWSLEHGADLVLLFPMHVKRHTLLSWLYERDAYRAPSLWSLIEVLRGLDPELLPRVNLSWYQAREDAGSDLVSSPTTCPHCLTRVVTLLDRYRERQCRSIVDDLLAIDCRCRDVWECEVHAGAGDSLPSRVLEGYRLLAHAFDLGDWWKEHGAETRATLFAVEHPLG